MKKLTLILAMSSIVAYGQGDTSNVMALYNIHPIIFGEYKQPKYKSLPFKTSSGSSIERIGWYTDSTLYMVLIDSNERKTTMKYKLIETK